MPFTTQESIPSGLDRAQTGLDYLGMVPEWFQGFLECLSPLRNLSRVVLIAPRLVWTTCEWLSGFEDSLSAFDHSGDRSRVVLIAPRVTWEWVRQVPLTIQKSFPSVAAFQDFYRVPIGP